MLLVVAWDGADFDLIDPWIKSGDLPAIARLIENGARRRVRSTIPAVTFPAWTSFMTAASPDRHGVTDFTVRRDGNYAVRFVNSTYRRLPTAWSLLSSAGRRVGVYALPATYPAEPINGVQVCGFDTPLGAGQRDGATFPANLGVGLAARYGEIAVGSLQQSRIDEGWHAAALGEMLETVRLRTRIVVDLLKEDRFDVFMVHFGESDTVSHHFWHYHDSTSPRHESGAHADALRRVYQELDTALAALFEAAGDDADVMLVSDHGSGGSSDRAIFWNRWLADSGFLAFKGVSAAGLAGRTAKALALRVLPPGLQASLFARLNGAASSVESLSRFSSIDWKATGAYSEELNYFPSIWLNLKGREPQGTVDECEHYGLEEKIIDALLEMRDPFDGQHVVSAVRRRKDVYDGPFAGQVPDLILELYEPDGFTYAGCSSRGGRERAAVRRLTKPEMSGRRGTNMPGAHRPLGMCVLGGPRIRGGRYPDGTLEDAGATMLAMAGVAPVKEANGCAWSDVLDLGMGELRLSAGESLPEPTPLSSAGERELASRLRSLGYLE